MPEHRIHRWVERMILGRERLDVDRWIDQPYRWLGPKHRILRHDPFTLFLKYHDDPEGFIAGLLHILTDFGVSEFNRKSGKFRKNAKRKKGKSKTKKRRR